jgi:tripartite motif-containing protein 71
VAVDGSGNVYVTDQNRVQKFTSSGTYVTQWGAPGSGDGQFNVPRGVAVDGSGNVYVADAHNYRIQKFGSLPVPATSTSWGRIKSLYW